MNQMTDLKRKLTSRKFWICVAAFLASIAASVTGVKTDNAVLTTIGFLCSTFSAAIYAAAEAAVDSARLKSEGEIDETRNDTDFND